MMMMMKAAKERGRKKVTQRVFEAAATMQLVKNGLLGAWVGGSSYSCTQGYLKALARTYRKFQQPPSRSPYYSCVSVWFLPGWLEGLISCMGGREFAKNVYFPLYYVFAEN
jgi:hypothetical protein